MLLIFILLIILILIIILKSILVTSQQNLTGVMVKVSMDTYIICRSSYSSFSFAAPHALASLPQVLFLGDRASFPLSWRLIILKIYE